MEEGNIEVKNNLLGNLIILFCLIVTILISKLINLLLFDNLPIKLQVFFYRVLFLYNLIFFTNKNYLFGESNFCLIIIFYVFIPQIVKIRNIWTLMK